MENLATKAYKTIDDLPTPKGTLVLGHLPRFNVNNKHQVLERWAKECGPLYRISFPGKKILVSADPEISKHILKMRPEHFRRYVKIDQILQEMGLLGVFNAEGDTWKKHRKVISEALNLRNLQSFFPIMAKTTEILLKKWKTLEKKGNKIDVKKVLEQYAVDITTSIGFGYDMNILEKGEDDIQNHLNKVFPIINQRMTAPLPLWRYYKSRQDRLFDQSLRALEMTVRSFIDEAKQRLIDNPGLKENPGNFLEALLVQQEIEGNFSDTEIYGNIFTLLLAGEDTTSNSISWTFYFLAQHPEIVRKIRNEAKAVYGSATFPNTFEAINKLKYTEAVIFEAIRIKPVSPNMFLEALQDVIINGLMIKKGTMVMLQNKVPQTEDQHFVQAEDFIPERWIKNECPVHGAHSPDMMLAFGAGPRYCPGRNLAMHEMILATSMTCKNFDMELAVGPENVKEVFNFTMYPEGLWIKLRAV